MWYASFDQDFSFNSLSYCERFVQLRLSNPKGFFQSITYQWLSLSELINWITFKQGFHVVQSERHGEGLNVFLEDMWINHEIFHMGSLTKPKDTYHRMIQFCYHWQPMKSWLTSMTWEAGSFLRSQSGEKPS